MGIIRVPHLEMMLTHSCTLRCEACGVKANYITFTPGLDAFQVDFDEAQEGLVQWSKRIYPGTFAMIGGEPTLHKDFFKFIRLFHRIWPDTARGIVTNGTLLHNMPELPALLRETNTRLGLSFHSGDRKYLHRIKKPIQLMQKWAEDYGIYCEIIDSRKFWRVYQGEGKNMKPFTHGDPASSWNACQAKVCKNFYNNRLWKCSQIRSLKPALEYLGIADSPDWKPYLQYNGIGLEASDEEVHRFFATGAEPICGMCPNSLDYFYKNVYPQQSAEVFTGVDESQIKLQQLLDYIKTLPD